METDIFIHHIEIQIRVLSLLIISACIILKKL